MATKTTRKIQKLRTGNPDLDRIQDYVERSVAPFITKEIIDGQILERVTLLPNAVNLVQHKLGRQLEGWIIIRRRADSNIWDIQDCNVNSDKTLALMCSHQVEVDIWVF